MRHSLRWLIISGALLCLAGLLIWAFAARREDKDDESDRPIKNPTLVTRSGTIKLNHDAQQLAGLRVEALAAASLAPEIVAYGRLEEDPARAFVLRAPISGTLRAREWPALGQTVADGATIGAVEPRLAPAERINLADRLHSARADMETAEAARSAAQKAYDRARALNADNKTVSDRVVEDAEARLKTEEARYAAASQTVRLIESSGGGSAMPAPLEIRRGGQVVEMMAQPGESIESGQPILRVARFDRLVARIDVPPGENRAAEAAHARLIVTGREDRPIPGERIALAAAVDPKVQGQSVLFRVNDGRFGLRPGQAVTAYLEVAGVRRPGVVVPRAAVVRYAGKAWIYTAVGDDEFARKEVVLEEATAGGWFSRSLSAGGRIVTVGAQTLLSEELKSQIQVGEENPQ